MNYKLIGQRKSRGKETKEAIVTILRLRNQNASYKNSNGQEIYFGYNLKLFKKYDAHLFNGGNIDDFINKKAKAKFLSNLKVKFKRCYFARKHS